MLANTRSNTLLIPSAPADAWAKFSLGTAASAITSIYTRKKFSPEKAVWFLLEALIHPPSIDIGEHLTAPWASQASSHPSLLLNTQGSGLHRWQMRLSLAQSLRISGASSPLPGTKFPPATADLGFHPRRRGDTNCST